MKSKTIGLILIAASVVIFSVTIIAKQSKAPVAESSGEAFVNPVQYIIFEPMEIKVPVTEYDFSNEEPMLITPDKRD
tara:strand:- start:111 stop:341 length:231 start_codon:yes stop_codon:yes gene_type:complete